MRLSNLLSLVYSINERKRLKMSTVTAFFRNVEQLKLLFDLNPSPKRIYVFGCSKGCEAYSLAMFYHINCQNHIPHIIGYDVDEKCIEIARKGIYSNEDLAYGKMLGDETLRTYLDTYFAIDNNRRFKIIDDIQSRCEFHYGSILNMEFMKNLDQADIVLCQNVLIHMSEDENRIALRLLAKLLRPGGLLVIGGMRLLVREKLTKEMGMIPVFKNCQNIHEAQIDLRHLWNSTIIFNRPYYAMPPFKMIKNWEYRFSTIFRFQ